MQNARSTKVKVAVTVKRRSLSLTKEQRSSYATDQKTGIPNCVVKRGKHKNDDNADCQSGFHRGHPWWLRVGSEGQSSHPKFVSGSHWTVV